jgi:hypothetical protein
LAPCGRHVNYHASTRGPLLPRPERIGGFSWSNLTEKDDSDYFGDYDFDGSMWIGRLGRRVSGRNFTSLWGRPAILLLRVTRGRPARHAAVSKTSGGAGTHTGHTGHTDHADEPHNQTDSPYTSSRSRLCRNMLLKTTIANFYGGMRAARPPGPPGDGGFVIEFGFWGGLLSGYVSHVSCMYRACIVNVS